MGDEETKARHSQRRKRNFLAKQLRSEREYLPKIHELKKNTRVKKINPRTVEITDDTDNDPTIY